MPRLQDVSLVSQGVACPALAHNVPCIPNAPAVHCRTSCEHRIMQRESSFLLFMCMILCMHDDLQGAASATKSLSPRADLLLTCC